jgi:uncharacterized protein (DUF433 family)
MCRGSEVIGMKGKNKKYQRVELGEYIVADPYVCHGAPTFKGTRKMVAHCVELAAEGYSIERLAEVSGLPREAIVEALRLAAVAVKEHFSVPYPEPIPTDELVKKYKKERARESERAGRVVRG